MPQERTHRAGKGDRGQALRRTLMRTVRPDVSRLARLLPELGRMKGRRWRGRDLLALTQRTIDCLAGGPAFRPRPAVRMAALFRQVGRAGRRGGDPLQRSALLCRDALRRAGIPFPVRSHAERLVACGRRPYNLVGSEAPPEAYMELACRLDTAALHHLEKAALQARAPGLRDGGRNRLKLFAAICRGFSAFGSPPGPLPGWDELENRGLTGGDLRRAANALRYFRVVEKVRDEAALRERLEEQVAAPPGRLHLLVGPAGCGKSTWAAENLSDTWVVSTDRMRERLTGDVEDQSRNYEVFKKCGRMLRSGLRDGHDVTFDATNYCRGVRQTPVAAARNAGAEVWSYVFDMELGEILARNRSRERRVPPEVIYRHWRGLEPPALYEADVCHVVDGRGRVERYWPD